ncbi:hypothetical protein BDZ97DRAFT_39997 [Flammula alnicola]|nr:hypothetical protein BDZ97DRAFT_39997 [Flammula alnicola]
MADSAVASEGVHDPPNTPPNSRVDANEESRHSPSPTPEIPPAGEEQALESHEVVELQTFSDRKTWIEEKIKFLEALPPVEVFVGLEAIQSSSEDVPGLPTRTELKQWMAEHDAIEKETEIFDTGELTKLRQLTKAATQRNLSPEDTDVIELTLTTIYALDKLLHLLRDRSENLDMMSIRLLWEENRQTGWRERRQIIEDLHAFAISRARWNPSIYELSPKNEDSNGLVRRGSITSQASAGSDNIINSPAFSRSARFRLAELLSRDAAQFSGRVTSLKHGKVMAAGKALDRLIDQSRKPVPEDLLDEQDRLEEKCITEMENIGKFTMNLVMQWRKADEIYVETMKDHASASNLVEEIETAKLYHPTARQSTSFISRADTILKRLAVRGDPASPATMFPCPEHSLFPDQKAANEALVENLSGEIASASKLARTVELAAKEYRTTYEAVKQVEVLLQSVNELSTTFISINKKFLEGVSGGEGDGSPPDLTSELCLNPTSHSVFLALLPSLLEDTKQAIESADRNLRSAPSALIALETPGIDHEFKENAASDVRKLNSLREDAVNLRDSVSKRVARLRESRKISSDIDSKLTLLKATKMQMVDTMEQDRWRQESGGIGAPPTPESPAADLHPVQSTSAEFEEGLLQVSSRLKTDINDPLDNLSATLESPLQACLRRKVTVLHGSLEDSHQLLRLLGAIRKQSLAMNSIRDNFHDIMMRIEDTKIRVTGMIEDVLEPKSKDVDSESNSMEHNIADATPLDLEPIQKEGTTFVDSLSNQVPFVAGHPAAVSYRAASLKSPAPSSDVRATFRLPDETVVLPFDLTSLDAAVRVDSNSYAMQINGNVETLTQLKMHFELAMMAKAADSALSSTVDETNGLAQELPTQKASFASIPRQTKDTIDRLQALLDGLEEKRSKRSTISRSLSPIRELLRRMDEKSKTLETSIRENLYRSRDRAVDDVELRLKHWEEEAATFKTEITRALDAEHRYQEELRAMEARRLREEEERMAAEAAARLQLERERLENEERQRLVEAKLAEERERQMERQRHAAELVEKQRLEREAAEAEQMHLDELRLAEEAARVQAEQDRLAKDEAERTRLEQERVEMLEKLRIAEAQLEEERRSHAESESAAMNLAKKHQLEMDELAKRQAEVQALAEEQARQVEIERAGKERAEREAKVHEEELTKQHSELRRLAEARALEAEIESAEKEIAKREARERADELEKQHVEVLRLAEEHARQAEKERAEKERAETKARELAEELEKHRLAEELVLQAEAERTAKEQAEKEAREHAEQEKMQVADKSLRKDGDDKPSKNSKRNDAADVFGIQESPTHSKAPRSHDLKDIQTQVLALRKRLRSICINEVLRPTKATAHLPTEEQFKKMNRDFVSVSTDVEKLPHNTDDGNLNTELKSLRAEVEESRLSLKKIEKLVDMYIAVQSCDAALSDLLEHIDSYPAIPLILSSTHKSVSTMRPEEQLWARLAFTKELLENMVSKFAAVVNDHRAISEHSRIQQTWSELHEMANDRIGGKKSRPASVTSRNSSGRDSSASANPPPSTHSRGTRKAGSYSHLSVSSASASKGKMLAPPLPPTKPRRAISGANEVASRSTSRLSSVSTTRSVSGPLNSSLYGSTFASRQRTTSLSNSVSTPPRRPSMAPSRFRLNSETKRGLSPAMSETSSYSHSHSSMAPSRSSVNPSTWSRAPRDSFSSILPRVMSPHKKSAPPVRKKYIADPKSKLDVAVGDVVNQLEVGINIEGITESWRDQSGKYWIGNQDPKLCFCRILRSQTVMVRVGGGWTELSRFIKDHFAESFRIAPGPESPPRFGAQTEKWISSATLLEVRESLSPPPAPRTPEPTAPFIPSFSLVTPSGHSPKSLKSTSPPSTNGSPLTPLQFIRRAEPELSLLRPVTPSKSPLRGRTSTSTTPARNSVWRP